MSDLIIAVPGSTGGIVLVEGIPGPSGGGVANVAAVSPLTVANSGGVATISLTGLIPIANITPSGTTGQVLTTTVGGSTVAWATPAVNAITQLTGDVTAGPGTGSVAATVVRVNGATVPAAGALTTGNAAYVSGASALTYSALNLAGGSGWITGNLPVTNIAPSGTNGQVLTTTAGATGWAALSVPVSSIVPGTAGQLLVTNAGATAAAWVSASQDATLAASGAFTVTQAQNGAVTFAANGGTNYLAASSASGLVWGASATPTIGQTAASGLVPATATWNAQAGTGAAAQGGAMKFNLPNPGTGNYGDFTFAQGGTAILAIGVPPNPTYSTYNCLWLGSTAAAPTVFNASFSQNGSQFQISDPNEVDIEISGNYILRSLAAQAFFYTSLNVGVNVGSTSGGTSLYGGGAGVLGIANATTQPTTATSGGCVLAANGGSLSVYDSAGAHATLNGSSIAWTGSNGPALAVNSSALALTWATTSSSVGTALTLNANNSSAGVGGAISLITGTGSATGGALTLNSGAGTTYGALGVVSSGNTPGQWNWKGAAMTQTQAVGGGGKGTLNVASGSFLFLPVTINGVTTAQIVVCV